MASVDREAEQLTIQLEPLIILKGTEPVTEPVKHETTVYDSSIPLDEYFQFIVFKESEAAGIDPYLIFAIMEQESKFDPDCAYHNTDGSTDYGIMQINSCNWKRMEAAGLDIRLTEDNIKAGVLIMSENLKEAEGSIPHALQGYNTGDSSYIGEYSQEVVGKWQKYKATSSLP